MALTDDAHQLIRHHFKGKSKGIAVDATCGNGFDSQFLAALGFQRVIGFDIQEVAINTTRERLSQAGYKKIELVLAGHQTMANYIDTKVDCVMFNFGYLPSGDKTIVTNPENSIEAIAVAAHLLSHNGLISLMCYPGHPSGAIETQAIRDWFKTLNGQWIVETHLAVSPKATAPILYLLRLQSNHRDVLN
ncbi:MAG: tRNA1(Val) A37 N6-methylase TrmN6 [Arenicella sp.]|jgi:tRNA1(Val) A37 N6-methylase TrmN6